MLLPDYIARLTGAVSFIAAAELRENRKTFFVIDIRESTEIESGMLPESTHIARGVLETEIERRCPDRSSAIVLYCAAGTRSILAAASLQEMGYANVKSLSDGIKAWKDSGFPLVRPTTVSASQETRYAAQLRLAEVGPIGQQKIRDAKVLIVGLGGLGSPAALYLAAAGVGKIGIIDDDLVELSNLQRQVLHTTDRIGMRKADSATLTLNGLNPTVRINPFYERLSRDNVDSLVSQYDIVLDGTDNFQTRYLINDACLKYNKLNVHGSVYGFEGQVAVFCADSGPCYRCLYPAPPPVDLSLTCAEAGVIGVLPGVIGIMQATETLKLILGVGQALIGKIAAYDALGMELRKLKVSKRTSCLCEHRKNIVYQDYVQFCSTK